MVFEVNYQDIEQYPPFGPSNNSVYVNAESEEEAIKIAMQKMSFKRNKLCFCQAIRTIN